MKSLLKEEEKGGGRKKEGKVAEGRFGFFLGWGMKQPQERKKRVCMNEREKARSGDTELVFYFHSQRTKFTDSQLKRPVKEQARSGEKS